MSKAVEKAVAKKSTAKSYKLVGIVKGTHTLNGIRYEWEAGQEIDCKTKKVFDIMKSLKALKKVK